MNAERLPRIAGGIAFAIGAAALVRPDQLVRLYGMDPGQMNGVSAFGWRLFAARNVVLGGAAIAGAPWARDITLLVQAPDQLIFAHAFRTRSIPRPTAVAAMASSGTVIALCLAARAADPD